MKYILIGLCLWFFQPVLSAQVLLNQQQCRDLALENSKQMGIARTGRDKALYMRKAYRADFFPRLSVSGLGFYNQEKYSYKLKGGYLPTYVPDAEGHLQPNVVVNPSTGKPVIGPDGTPLFQEYAFLPDIGIRLGMRGVYLAGIQLEQPLYMGGKIREAHEMAKIGEEVATVTIRLNRSEVLLETDKAYWQLVRVQEQVNAARAYLKVVGELLQNLKNAEQVGMAIRNDVLKVQVRYNEALLLLQKAENGQVLSRMDLCRLVGLSLHTDIRTRDTLPETAMPGIWDLPGSVEGRPDYTLLKYETDVKNRQIRLTHADYLPQVGISVGYGYGGGIELNGERDANASFNAMASVKIPLFYWGEGRNKIKAAQADEEISRLNLEKSVQLMELEITAARFNITDALTRIEMSRNALKEAAENLRISRNQYEVGLENLTNLLEAQAQWQQARSQWVDAKAELQLSETRYLKAIGRLGD